MKKFISKILDVPKLIITVWIILWLILIILLIMKFCFGIWYPIVVENKSFMNVCNFIDENKWLSLMVMGTFYLVNSNLIFLIATGKKHYFYKWYYIVLSIIIIPVLMFYIKSINNIVGNIVEVIVVVLIPILINIKTKRFYKTMNILVPIILYVLITLWQFTILIIRGTSELIISDLPSLIYLILQLDYYILLIITYMGVCTMGLLGIGWFWSKDITVLKAEKEKELAKATPNMKKVESLDIRIAELEKEGK